MLLHHTIKQKNMISICDTHMMTLKHVFQQIFRGCTSLRKLLTTLGMLYAHRFDQRNKIMDNPNKEIGNTSSFLFLFGPPHLQGQLESIHRNRFCDNNFHPWCIDYFTSIETNPFMTSNIIAWIVISLDPIILKSKSGVLS